METATPISQSVTVPLSQLPAHHGHQFSITGDGQLTMLWDEVFQPDRAANFDDDTVFFAALQTGRHSTWPRSALRNFQAKRGMRTTAGHNRTMGNTEPPVVTSMVATFLHGSLTPFTDPGASAVDSKATLRWLCATHSSLATTC